METQSIVVGAIIGIIVGGLVGFMVAPSPDTSSYQTEINTLTAQVTSLQNEIANLEDELDDAISQSDYNTLERQVTRLQSEVSSLENQLSDSEDEIEDLEDQLDDKDDLISDLQVQIQSLQDIFNYTPGDWNVIKTWSGSADKTTELFTVSTNQIRITWDLDPEQYSTFTIWLFEEGDEYYTEGWLSLDEQPQGETYAYISPGNYYLEFSVYNCGYTVTVETQIP